MKLVACLGMLALAAAPPAEDGRKIGEPGRFDYYLMTMSWSPAYCAAKSTGPTDPQCGTDRHFAFVLHGLWPQYTRQMEGSFWPQFCSGEPGLKDPAPVLDIMPSPSLIAHEWAKHGTCTGLNPEGYFALARQALASVKPPPAFESPTAYQTMKPAALKKQFLKANPALSASSIAIQCSSNFLSEVRVCMDKNLKPVPCTGQKECKASTIRVPPVR